MGMKGPALQTSWNSLARCWLPSSPSVAKTQHELGHMPKSHKRELLPLGSSYWSTNYGYHHRGFYNGETFYVYDTEMKPPGYINTTIPMLWVPYHCAYTTGLQLRVIVWIILVCIHVLVCQYTEAMQGFGCYCIETGFLTDCLETHHLD